VPDFFTSAFSNGPAISVPHVALRLVLALIFGAVVAWIYTRTSRDRESLTSFPVTLALLAVLIAMVTQVIGDNVARAFSLVGALSIVRFRTVVRDTKDTAFVIFAVVVGMAVGAQNPWVAVIGIVVVGCAAFYTARRDGAAECWPEPFLITVRVGLGYDAGQILGGPLAEYMGKCSMICVNTAKQGAALNITYEGRLRRSASPEALVKMLNAIDGVQDVRFERRDKEG
jgi:hypothetical protein